MLKLRSEAIEWREVEGEIVALDLRDQMYLGVNGSGTVLWPLLVEGADREALVGALVDTYDIDTATAGPDVDAFVAMLAERDLLEPAT